MGSCLSHEIKKRESEWHSGKFQHAKDRDGEGKALYKGDWGVERNLKKANDNFHAARVS